MRHRFVVVLLFVAAALLAVPGTATACACDCMFPSPAKQVRSAEAVFTGTVVAAHQLKDDSVPTPPIVYTFRVDHLYKGPPNTEFKVATTLNEGTCGRRFDLASRYLVIAKSGAKGSGLFAVDPGVPLYTSQCLSNRKVRPGDGPLRKEDGFQQVEALTDDLLTVLDTAARTQPSAVVAQPEAPGEGPVSPWFYAGAVVVVLGLAVTAWRLFRRAKTERSRS